jgi:hypothetical protein
MKVPQPVELVDQDGHRQSRGRGRGLRRADCNAQCVDGIAGTLDKPVKNLSCPDGFSLFHKS